MWTDDGACKLFRIRYPVGLGFLFDHGVAVVLG